MTVVFPVVFFFDRTEVSKPDSAPIGVSVDVVAAAKHKATVNADRMFITTGKGRGTCSPDVREKLRGEPRRNTEVGVISDSCSCYLLLPLTEMTNGLGTTNLLYMCCHLEQPRVLGTYSRVWHKHSRAWHMGRCAWQLTYQDYKEIDDDAR